MRKIEGVLLAALVALPVAGFCQEATEEVSWKSSISLGATFKDGNTEKALYTMNLKGDRFAPESDWINSLYAEYGKTEGTQTEGQLRGQSNYRYKFDSKDFYGGVFVEAYHDAIKEINARVKIGPNIGYYFINEEKMKLDGSFGINYVHQRVASRDDDFAEWRVAGNYLWTISETSSFYANAEYSASVEDSEDGTGLGVVGAKNKMNEKLSMFVELREEYDNIPAAGRDHTDTTLLAGLTYDIM